MDAGSSVAGGYIIYQASVSQPGGSEHPQTLFIGLRFVQISGFSDSDILRPHTVSHQALPCFVLQRCVIILPAVQRRCRVLQRAVQLGRPFAFLGGQKGVA